MSKVVATITVSLDGYVTGPDDGPGHGLGIGGERLHYWVMGGPWTYETDHEPGAGMTDGRPGVLRRADRRAERRHVRPGHVRLLRRLGRHQPLRRHPGRPHPPHRGPARPEHRLRHGRRLRRGVGGGPARRPTTPGSRSVAAPTSSGRRWRPGSSTSSASPPLRSCSAAASGCSRASTTTSTSTSCRSTTRRTPSTCRFTVDTHFGRMVRRLGWTEETDPVKVEHEIGALFPKADWTMLSHHLIWHGRRRCHAKKPACGACPVARWCPSYGTGPTDPEVAAALVKTQGPA